jgi:hypothetical protein
MQCGVVAIAFFRVYVDFTFGEDPRHFNGVSLQRGEMQRCGGAARGHMCPQPACVGACLHGGMHIAVLPHYLAVFGRLRAGGPEYQACQRPERRPSTQRYSDHTQTHPKKRAMVGRLQSSAIVRGVEPSALLHNTSAWYVQSRCTIDRLPCITARCNSVRPLSSCTSTCGTVPSAIIL